MTSNDNSGFLYKIKVCHEVNKTMSNLILFSVAFYTVRQNSHA